MPNQKRARQKAAKHAYKAQQAALKRRKQRIRAAAVLVVIAIAIFGLIYYFQQSSSKTAKPAHATTTTTSTTPTTTPTPPAKTTPQAAIQPTCPPKSGPVTRHTNFTHAPGMCISLDKIYTATVKTDIGTFVVTMNPKQAPKTVNNFVFLARWHFFNGIIFHRVIPGFVVQGGDPTGTGYGGPGYYYTGSTPAAGSYKLGSVAMANSGKTNTDGSQFFIIVGPQGTSLPPNYTLFGQVTSGMNVVNQIAKDGSASGTPTVIHKMLSVTITSSP
ncbi:MAG: peptidylprolyl isomerase [Actinobacteria bacterium]|nr:peptidylprolyl isomerase [Actinomycetota bacterium]MCL6105602.1 peptidylprolyl isomerase [Actinomycetota bacterium]